MNLTEKTYGFLVYLVKDLNEFAERHDQDEIKIKINILLLELEDFLKKNYLK